MTGRIRLGAALLAVLTCSASAAWGADDPRHEARVELGRRLFFDPAVGRRGTIACASCHDPEAGFSDPSPRSRDETETTPRHSQSLLDLADRQGPFHWDGEFATLRELITARIGHPAAASRDRAERLAHHLAAAERDGAQVDVARLTAEVPRTMDLNAGYGSVTPSTPRPPRGAFGDITPSAREVPRRLADGGLYDAGFRAAFGTTAIDDARIATALEAYVLSLRSTESPFDRYMAGEDRALGPAATRGLDLFAGKAGCTTCHTIPVPGKGRALSDGRLHNTGVAFLGSDDGAALDVGRSRVSLRTADTGSFVTPGLRDVARTAPYMHDGFMRSLDEVVRYYDGGGTRNAHQDPALRPLGLTDVERADLVAFLESLTGTERPGLGDLLPDRAERLTVKVVDLDGKALSGVTLLVRPSGDRLRGTTAMPEAFEVTTSRSGEAAVAFPASTHVALDLPGHELGESRLLPDWTRDVTLIATPVDMVSVIVRMDGKPLPSELHLRGAGMPAGLDDRVLRRVRHLRGGGTLYAAPIGDVTHIGRVVTVSMRGGHAAIGPIVFDASGGASETVEPPDAAAGRRHAETQAAAISSLFRTLSESEIGREALSQVSRPRTR